MHRCTAIAILLAIGCASHGSDDDKPLHRQCEQLRDHVIDLRLASAGSDSGLNLEAHRTALRQAIGKEFTSSCETRMSREQIKCALAASDSAAANACSSK